MRDLNPRNAQFDNGNKHFLKVLILTHSGRLFYNNLDNSHKSRETSVFEFPLTQLGIPLVECISSKTAFEESSFVIGCKDGSLYRYNGASDKLDHEVKFEKISDHELQDGSRIEKVHEICELMH